MDIKFWKKGGGHILIKDIWHMESALYFVRFYTKDDREFEVYMTRNTDDTYSIIPAYLIERKSWRDYEKEEWISKLVSKTEVIGWIAVPKDECYEI